MSLFTSSRERHLWLWALAVTVAIYATLGPARTLADALRARNLLEASFALLVFLLVAAIVIPWLRRRPGWSEIGVAPGIALAYGLAIPAGDLNGPPGWALFGAITGAVLVWLLRQEPSLKNM